MKFQKKRHLMILPRSVYVFEFLVSALAVGITSPIKGNQFMYFARLHANIVKFPVDDWFLGTPDSNPFFTWLVQKLIFGESYLALNLVNFCLIFMGVHYLNEIVLLILNIRKSSINHFSVIIVTLSGFALIFPDFSNGLGGMGFFGSQLQPSSFDLLLIFSIYIIIKNHIHQPVTSAMRQYLKIFIPILIADSIHPSISLSSLFIVLAFISSKINQHNSKIIFLIRKHLAFLILISIAIPFIFRYLPIEKMFYTKADLAAFEYFSQNRIPYHTLPSSFMHLEDSLRVLIICVGLYILNKKMDISYRVKLFFRMLIFLSIYTSVCVFIINKSIFSLLVPWRISGALYPLFALLFLVYVIKHIENLFLTNSYKLFFSTLLLVALVLVFLDMKKFLVIFIIMIFINLYLSHLPQKIFDHTKLRGLFTALLAIIGLFVSITNEVNTIAAWKSQYAIFPPSEKLVSLKSLGPGIVPPQYMNFRIDYGLSIFVDSQSVPFDPKAMAEWVARLKLSEASQKNPELLCTNKKLENIRWAIFSEKVTVPTCFDKIDILDDTWVLATGPKRK